MSLYVLQQNLSYRYIIMYNDLLRDQSLDIVSTVNDLSIIFDRELNFHGCIERSCCKVRLKTLSFIKRGFTKFNLLAPLKSWYCTFVRYILEYTMVIWDTNTVIAKSQIERVQWKFLNFASKVLHIAHQPHDYKPVLIKLGLATLTVKHISASQDFLRKLLDRSINCPNLLCELNFKVSNFHSRSPYLFFIPVSTTNYSYNRPIFKIVRIANENVSASTF